ncbi:MAG: DMT family transporter [Bacteroidota bacterium]|nr:DMT family transporter [Bacteroidota bacterium]
MKQKGLYWYHVIALLTIAVWGTTYVVTKILLSYGLSPAEIFLCRFLLAYVAIWTISWKQIWADNLKDEVFFLALGMTGGSLYFLFENTALSFSLASNVALILCVAPILTTFLVYLFNRSERIRLSLILGSLMAFTGVFLVIYNGDVILKLNPLGDFLTVMAALMWAFYSVLIKNLGTRYPIFFVTRKIFFYGLLTILPVFLFHPFAVPFQTLLIPQVGFSLLFLGLVASMLCYISWNMAAKKLGVVRVTNYIYFSPIVTLITAAIVIKETITPVALAGSVFIISGVYLANKEDNRLLKVLSHRFFSKH